jgi:alanine racemase
MSTFDLSHENKTTLVNSKLPMNHPAPATAGQCSRCLRPETEAWGRSHVEIDLAAFRRNTARVFAALPVGGRLIVSAKKDGYGHGMLATIGAIADLPQLGAIGVATVEEGVALRHAGITLPVICFSVLEDGALAEAIRHNLWLTVTNLAEAAAADAMAAQLNLKARAHFKLDTGMGRTGRLGGEIIGQIPGIRRLGHLELTAVYSHLADAWADPASARAQFARLAEFRQRAGLDHLLCHWGGSDAMALPELLSPGMWLRSGIALYGDHPTVAGLEPVMTFKSRVIYRRRVPAGTAISYGGTYQTTRETELAMIGSGYGNGLPRALSGRGSVLLRGRRCPILGRVCMDQVIVDVTGLGDIAMGEEAVIFGRQGGAVLPAAEQAALAGTISYELFCLAGQLNPRMYV